MLSSGGRGPISGPVTRTGTSALLSVPRAVLPKKRWRSVLDPRVSDAMSAAIEETNRRRDKQLAYNALHGITPESVRKRVHEVIRGEADVETDTPGPALAPWERELAFDDVAATDEIATAGTTRAFNFGAVRFVIGRRDDRAMRRWTQRLLEVDVEETVTRMDNAVSRADVRDVIEPGDDALVREHRSRHRWQQRIVALSLHRFADFEITLRRGPHGGPWYRKTAL